MKTETGNINNNTHWLFQVGGTYKYENNHISQDAKGFIGIFHFLHRRLRCRNACKRAHADQNQVAQHEQHRQLPFIIIRFVRKAEGSQV